MKQNIISVQISFFPSCLMMTPIEELESVLLAVPEMLHGDIRNHVNDVGIIETVVEDVYTSVD